MLLNCLRRAQPVQIACMLAAMLLLLVAGISVLFTGKPSWYGTFKPSDRFELRGAHGAVASDNALCSQMGVDVLRRGGSAADAAVQVALCIGSVEPQSSGIGGGGFITLRFPNGTALSINCRETAPQAAHKHMYDENPMLAKVGGLAAGVPGELAGLHALFSMAGSRNLTWKELVDPVADLNELGFLKGDGLKHAITVYEEAAPEGTIERMLEMSDWCWLFGDREQCWQKSGLFGSRLFGSGLFSGSSSSKADQPDWVTRPRLAATLRTIANEGVDAFYRGKTAARLAEFAQEFGGVLTPEDFAGYEVEVSPVLNSTFQNLTVLTAPAPASGPALVMGLNAVAELLASRRHPHNARAAEEDPAVNQRLVEVMKWMAAARSELGDPNFVTNPKIDEMLSPEWAARVVGNISDDATLPSWRDYHPSYEMNNPQGTTHFSIVDSHGMAVAMTTTVNLPFGNLLCDPVTGVILNSEMDDFSVPKNKNSFELAPSIYNFVQPGKRPLSSAVPTVVIDPSTNEVVMTVGAAGGSRILTSVFLALVRTYGLNLTGIEAVSFPRYHHQLIPEQLMVEPGFSGKRQQSWEDHGHSLDHRKPGSSLNLVVKEGGMWHAVSDYYRRRGLGAAY